MSDDPKDLVPEPDQDHGFAAEGEPEALEPEKNEAETPADETPAPEPEKGDAPDWEARFHDLEAQLNEVRDQQSRMPQPQPDDPWKAIREDYPDLIDPIQAQFDRQQQQFGQALAEVQTRQFEEAMDVARPDWRELRKDQGFADWLKDHPKQAEAAQRPGVRSAMGVLNAYDAHRKAAQVQAQREARLQAAQSTPARGSRAPSLSDALDGWAAD